MVNFKVLSNHFDEESQIGPIRTIKIVDKTRKV